MPFCNLFMGRPSYMSALVTLNVPRQRNGQYFALLHQMHHILKVKEREGNC